MIQDIIAYLIIGGASVAFLYRILTFFNLVGRKTTKASGCAGCSGGCEIKHTNTNLFRNGGFKKRNLYQFYS